jgi:hypothetical protein
VYERCCSSQFSRVWKASLYQPEAAPHQERSVRASPSVTIRIEWGTGTLALVHPEPPSAFHGLANGIAAETWTS